MALIHNHADMPGRAASLGDAGARSARSLWRSFVARPEPRPAASPWGAIAGWTDIAPGILWFRTADRSGYRLSPKRQRALPRALRTADAWYEDRTEWAAVAVVFDRIFERMPAGNSGDCSVYDIGKQTLRNWRPEEYESWFQTELSETEIQSLAIIEYHRRHAGRWIVVPDRFRESAPILVDGRLRLRARFGGDPPFSASSGHALGPCRWFLVDAREFTEARGKPFLIDPERHYEINEPRAD